MVAAFSNSAEDTRSQKCAYCLWALSHNQSEDIVRCHSCNTPYHEDCFSENGGCTVFGCPEWTAKQLGVPVSQTPIVIGTSLGASTTPVTDTRAGTTNHSRPSFCTNCGKGLASDELFCTSCGKRIEE